MHIVPRGIVCHGAKVTGRRQYLDAARHKYGRRVCRFKVLQSCRLIRRMRFIWLGIRCFWLNNSLAVSDELTTMGTVPLHLSAWGKDPLA